MISPTPIAHYSIEFEINGLPKTPNQMLRGYWASKLKQAKLWARLVSEAVALAGGPAKPLKKAVVTCTRISSGKVDTDGLYGSFKFVIDGLVKARVIEDDSPSHIELRCLAEKGKQRKGKIRVRVEELVKGGG